MLHAAVDSKVIMAGGSTRPDRRCRSRRHWLPPPHGVAASSSTSSPPCRVWQRLRSTPLKSCTPTMPKTKKQHAQSRPTWISRGVAVISAFTVVRMLSMRLTVRSGRSSRIVRSAPTPLTSSCVAGMSPRIEKSTTVPSSQFHGERRYAPAWQASPSATSLHTISTPKMQVKT